MQFIGERTMRKSKWIQEREDEEDEEVKDVKEDLLEIRTNPF